MKTSIDMVPCASDNFSSSYLFTHRSCGDCFSLDRSRSMAKVMKYLVYWFAKWKQSNCSSVSRTVSTYTHVHNRHSRCSSLDEQRKKSTFSFHLALEIDSCMFYAKHWVAHYHKEIKQSNPPEEEQVWIKFNLSIENDRRPFSPNSSRFFL